MKKNKSAAKSEKRKMANNPTDSSQKKIQAKLITKGIFPIVGIGASAGGLEALEQFFSHMPQNNGMSFVVIQHLDPSHKGVMPELLQRITTMDVVPVTDGLKVKPDSVYVIPPNTSMSIFHNTLHLFEPVETRGLRLPVDFFFRSLAEDRKEGSIGVILSGMGSDGSMGVRKIKEVSGLVLVQDPRSAKFDGMPRSAIDAVNPDIIAPPNELPQRLITYIANISAIKPKTDLEKKDKTALEKIIILLRSQTGNDFSLYKKNAIYRRVERRMNVHKIDKIAHYVSYLQENPAEVNILFKELLIGVTSFFRDSAVWEKLRTKVIPELVAKLPSGYTVRVWIPGCSTGEEAFSLAIIFKEAMEVLKTAKALSFQIFATDLDGDAINKARKGVYPLNITADVSQARMKRFFVKTESGYRVATAVREMVVFATQNIVKDPPFTNLDMLICRNLLIYMESEMQRKLIALFNYSLKPGGILVLGSAETNGGQTRHFGTVEQKMRIYQQAGTTDVNELVDFPNSFSRSGAKELPPAAPSKSMGDIQTYAEQIVLQRYSPPSVIANSKGDIVYIIGRIGNYFEPAAGKAAMNIFAMARRGLQIDLPNAFRQAVQKNREVVLKNTMVGTNGGTQAVDITIQPLDKPEALKGMVLIVFYDRLEPGEPKPIKFEKKGKAATNAYIKKLETELQHAKEDLQGTLEEMQTSQEELKSTNEELQSTNEELQSTNEELTTSKEEMQSLNEELQTANMELQSKVDDFSRLESDMKNLLDSTGIATLFLDRNLQIRRFTPEVSKIFKVITGDVGRPFTDLVSELIYPDLSEDAIEVMRSLVFVEKAVSTRSGKWYRTRIMPYRTVEDKIEGLVITFIDVSKLKAMEMSFRDITGVLPSLINESMKAALILTPDGKILQFNSKAEKLFSKSAEDVIGRNYFELFVPDGLRKEVENHFIAQMGEGSLERFETKIKSSSDGSVPVVWTINKLYDEYGKVETILFIEQKPDENE